MQDVLIVPFENGSVGYKCLYLSTASAVPGLCLCAEHCMPLSTIRTGGNGHTVFAKGYLPLKSNTLQVCLVMIILSCAPTFLLLPLPFPKLLQQKISFSQYKSEDIQAGSSLFLNLEGVAFVFVAVWGAGGDALLIAWRLFLLA